MNEMDDRGRQHPTYAESLREYGRGLGGGLLFSLPLLYTMEVWWHGFIADPQRLLAYLAATFALLLGYNRYAGMHHDAHWTEVAIDSVEELGLGVVTAAAFLALLGRITLDMSVEEVMGKTVVEAGVVAIGYSVGTAQLGERADRDGEKKNEKEPHFRGQLVIALCGAVLIAANVAPTEEIVVIAAEIGEIRQLAIIGVSVLLGMLILFFSNFTRSSRVASVGSAGEAVLGALVTYIVALGASAAGLWFFGRFEGAGVEMILAQSVVLSLPATLGASAGRLLLQS